MSGEAGDISMFLNGQDDLKRVSCFIVNTAFSWLKMKLDSNYFHSHGLAMIFQSLLDLICFNVFLVFTNYKLACFEAL